MTKADTKTIKSLQQALDRLEGKYSGIPECCVESYASGVDGVKFVKKLTVGQKEKWLNSCWGYIPCMDCFNKNKIVKIKTNGTSLKGRLIRTIIHEIQGLKTY